MGFVEAIRAPPPEVTDTVTPPIARAAPPPGTQRRYARLNCDVLPIGVLNRSGEDARNLA